MVPDLVRQDNRLARVVARVLLLVQETTEPVQMTKTGSVVEAIREVRGLLTRAPGSLLETQHEEASRLTEARGSVLEQHCLEPIRQVEADLLKAMTQTLDQPALKVVSREVPTMVLLLESTARTGFPVRAE